MIYNFKNLKAVFFDLDGVICDTEPLRFKSYQELFRIEFQKDLPSKYMRKRVGLPLIENFKFYLKVLGVDNYDLKLLIKKRNIILSNLISKNISYDKKTYDLFYRLSNLGLKIILVTNSSSIYAKNILSKLNILTFFDHIVSGSDLKISKPNPEIYNIALNIVKLQKSEIIAIEDTNSGVEAATTAGLTCHAIKRDYIKSINLNKKLIYNNIFEIFE